MKDIIINELRKMERTENIKILLAVESGSRAWGFASPDSDYDVRFIYARPNEYYLRLDNTRDVIELPFKDNLDISGWDLSKTLRLLHKSNPTLFEWFSSPIAYITTDFSEHFKPILNHYFLEKKALYHYISMAEGNFREYIKTDNVIAKKYFYVLRPVLACKWILDNGTPPPMLFSELVTSELDESLMSVVDTLLDLKINSPEVRKIKRIDELNEYLEFNIKDIKKKISELPNLTAESWGELNKLFLSVIRE